MASKIADDSRAKEPNTETNLPTKILEQAAAAIAANTPSGDKPSATYIIRLPTLKPLYLQLRRNAQVSNLGLGSESLAPLTKESDHLSVSQDGFDSSAKVTGMSTPSRYHGQNTDWRK